MLRPASVRRKPFWGTRDSYTGIDALIHGAEQTSLAMGDLAGSGSSNYASPATLVRRPDRRASDPPRRTTETADRRAPLARALGRQGLAGPLANARA